MFMGVAEASTAQKGSWSGEERVQARKFFGIRSAQNSAALSLQEAYLLGGHFLLEEGGLELLGTPFLKNSQVVFVTANSKEKVRLERFNVGRQKTGQKPIAIVRTPGSAAEFLKEQAKRAGKALDLQGLVSPGEVSQEWIRILKKNIHTLDHGRLIQFAREFHLNRLMEDLTARFQSAKSA